MSKQIKKPITLDFIRKNLLPVHKASMEEAARRWSQVAKPLFSLGKLEEAIIQMAGIKRAPIYQLKKRALIIMCADNGVVEEGVTQTGQEVTAIVAHNFTQGETSVSIMSQVAQVDVFPVDIGMATCVPSVTKEQNKVAWGTKNMAREPAMTKEEVWQAILTGIKVAEERKEQGYDIIATGEMGIGNTTTSSAVATVLLDRSVEEVTGKGAGLTAQGLEKKVAVIQQAIEKHRPDREDVLDVLAKVGGLDLAGLAGVCLGAALCQLPVVVDGFIAATAALCARRLVPAVGDYLMPSHVSKEPGGKILLDALSLSPLLTCDMCLGEGSGAVAVMPLLDMGLQVYLQMSTFEDIEIENYKVLK